MLYFLTIAHDDCETRVYTQQRIEEILADPEGCGIRRFLDQDFAGTDPDYWKAGEALLVRGEVIVPQPVETVTSWRLP